MLLPEKTILFMINAQLFINSPAFIQAIWNLRDDFKSNFRMLVLLGNQIKLPTELEHDFIYLDQDLPDDDELSEIITSVASAADVTIKPKDLDMSVNALRGMSAFPAEQAVAMSLHKDGVDVDNLWLYKRKLIDSTPGLKVYKGDEKFDNIGGCDAVKQFLNNTAKGKEPPRVIVFIDEGEKMFAGATNDVGDNTGVSQDSLATTLAFMEDNNADGSIFVGPPGAAKSAIAKAFGNEVGIPTIMMDLGGLKGSLVGESEKNLRHAFKVISAISGGQVYFILTCNKDVSLPPELKRRFTSGTFFFDLPTTSERGLIWNIYTKKYSLPEQKIDDNGWTGAEIRNCCRLAYRQNVSINDASNYIVPVAVSAKEQIQSLRKVADGKYLSANRTGIYRSDYADEISVKTRKAVV